MIARKGTQKEGSEFSEMPGPRDNWTPQSATGGPTREVRSTTPNEIPLVDVEGALRRLGGDRALLACLAKVFNEDSPELLNRLASSVATMEGEQIRKAAHALRGLVANFGSQSLMQSLRQLEELGARDDLKRAKELLAEISEKTARLQNSLSDLS